MYESRYGIDYDSDWLSAPEQIEPEQGSSFIPPPEEPETSHSSRYGIDYSSNWMTPEQPEPVEMPEPTEDQSLGGDLWNAFGRGSANLAHGAGWVLDKVGFDGASEGIHAYADRALEYYEGMSEETKADMDKEFLRVKEGGSAWNPLDWERPEDAAGWRKALMLGAESLPSTAVGMGVGGKIAEGLYGITKLFGGAKGIAALETAAAAGVKAKAMGAVADDAVVLAGKRAERFLNYINKSTTAVGYGLGETAVSAPMTGAQVKQRVMSMDHDFLMLNSPEYRHLYEVGEGEIADADLPEEEYRELIKGYLADRASSEAALKSGWTTFLFGSVAGAGYASALNKTPFAKPFASGKVQGLVKGAVAEAAEEAPQSGFEQYFANTAVKKYADATQDASEGVFDAVVGGVVAGAGMGGALGFSGAETKAGALINEQRQKDKAKAGEDGIKITEFTKRAASGLMETHGLSPEQATEMLAPVLTRFKEDQNIVKAVADLRFMEKYGRARETGVDDVSGAEEATPTEDQAKPATGPSDTGEGPPPAAAGEKVEKPKPQTGPDGGVEGVRFTPEPDRTRHGIQNGYEDGTIGADGGRIDVLQPQTTTGNGIFVIEQTKADGTFDEHKVITGVSTEAEAVAAYQNYYRGYEDEQDRNVGSITQLNETEYREWAAATTEQYGQRLPSSEVLKEQENERVQVREPGETGSAELSGVSRGVDASKQTETQPAVTGGQTESKRKGVRERVPETGQAEGATVSGQPVSGKTGNATSGPQQTTGSEVDVPESPDGNAAKPKGSDGNVDSAQEVPRGEPSLTKLDQAKVAAKSKNAQKLQRAGEKLAAALKTGDAKAVRAASEKATKAFQKLETEAQEKTKGHDTEQGGLRGHSMGSSYPYMVVGVGDKWAVQTPDGKISTQRFDDSGGAEAHATKLRAKKAKASAKKLRGDKPEPKKAKPDPERLEGLPESFDVKGQSVKSGYHAPAREAANRYAKSRGLPAYEGLKKFAPLSPKRGTMIAREFALMEHTPEDPLVKAAYAAMMEETAAQYEEILKTGLKVEFIGRGEAPYTVPREVILDVINNNHMYVFSTKDGFGSDETVDVSQNPLLSETKFKDANGQPMLANDVFRVVHDYFGHIMNGVGFRGRGEENAWQAHAAMYTPLARRAMTVETRGQNSWVNFGPHAKHNRTASQADTIYADQKIGLLPIWVSEEGRLSETIRRNDPVYTAGLEGAIGEDGRVRLSHFGKTEFDRTDPSRAGQGLDYYTYGRRWLPRATYFGITQANEDKYRRESGLGVVEHEATLEPTSLYPANADPENLWVRYDPEASIENIKNAGFSGYWANDSSLGKVAVVWDALQVKPVGKIQELPNGALFNLLPGYTYQDPFYSALTKTVEEAKGMPKKGKPEAFIQWLDGRQKNGDFKQEEREWMGLDEWLSGPALVRERLNQETNEWGTIKLETLTQEDVQEFVRANQIVISETLLAGRGDPEEDDIIDGVEITSDWEVDEPDEYYLQERAEDRLDDAITEYAEENEIDEEDVTQEQKDEILEKLTDEERDWHYQDDEAPQSATFEFGGYTYYANRSYGELQIYHPDSSKMVYEGRDIYDSEIKVQIYQWARDQGYYEDEDYDGEADGPAEYGDRDYSEAGDYSDYKELLLTIPTSDRSQDVFTGGHYSEDNIVVHTRFDNRVDASGKRILFIEEIQSDWHQHGRESGYITPEYKAEQKKFVDEVLMPALIPAREVLIKHGHDRDEIERRRDSYSLKGLANLLLMKGPEKATLTNTDRHTLQKYVDIYNTYENSKAGGPKIPDAPFKASSSWSMLAMKRMIRWAAENGYDRIAWTSGDMQNRRWRLSNHVDSISLRNPDPEPDERSHKITNDDVILLARKDGRNIIHKTFARAELPSQIGKERAELLLSRLDEWSKLSIYKTGKEANISTEGWTIYLDMPSREASLEVYFDGEFVTRAPDEETAIDFISAQSNTPRPILEGEEIELGGEGMRGFYDKILPLSVNKYVKKWGGKTTTTGIITGNSVTMGEIAKYHGLTNEQWASDETDRDDLINQFHNRPNKGEPVHALDITPQMKEAALAGQAMFALRGWTPQRRAEQSAKMTEMNNARAHAKRLYDRTDWSKIEPTSDSDTAGANTPEEIQDAIVEYTLYGISSKYFRRWFGKGQVTDSFGTPLTLFHGSQSSEITAFNTRQSHRGFVSLSTDPLFSSSFAVGSDYHHPTMYVVYTNAQKVFDFRNKKMRRSLIRYIKDELPDSQKPYMMKRALEGDLKSGDWSFLEHNITQQFIKNRGYDAFYMMENGYLNIGVFNANQIKSATGNAGTFSPNTNDIMLDTGAEVVSENSRRIDLKNLFNYIVANTNKDTTPAAMQAHIDMGLDMDMYSAKAAKLADSTLPRARLISRLSAAMRGPDVVRRASLTQKVVSQEVAKITASLEGVTGGWARPPKFTVHETWVSLPDHIRDQVKGFGYQDRVRGLYDPVTNEIHMVASNLGNMESVHKTFVEESLGHFGMRQFFGSELDNFLREVLPSVQGTKAWGDLMTSYPHLKNGIDQGLERYALNAVEELIVKQEVDQTVWQKFVSWVRGWLRSRGLVTNYTENDLKRVLSQVHNRVINGDMPHPWGAKNYTAELDGDGQVVFALNPPAGNDVDLDIIKNKIARPESEMTVASRVKRWVTDMRQGIASGDVMWGMKQGMLDDAASVERWEIETFGEVQDAAISPHKMMHLTKNLPSVMAAISKVGIPEYRNGAFQPAAGRKGLIEILRPLYENPEGNLLDLWQGYASARRANELIQQTNDDGTSREKLFDQGEINRLLALGNKYPVFKDVFDDWQSFNRDLLDLAVDRGVLTPDERDVWSQNDYVPFYRAMEEIEGVDQKTGFGAVKAGVSGQHHGIKRLYGGTEMLGNVVENIWFNTASLVDKIYKNEAMNRVVDMLDGIAMKQIQMPWEAVKISNDQLATALGKAGLLPAGGVQAVKAMSAAQQLKWSTVFRRVKPTAPNVVSVMRNGKLAYFEVEDENLLRTLNGLSAEGLTGLMKAMGMSKSILTRMITIDPGFMLANWMRDTLSAWVTSDANFIPVVDSIASMKDVWKEDGTFVKMMMAGAGGGGFYDLTGGNVTSALNSELGSGGWMKKAWRGYMKIGAMSENSNRLAIANRILANGGTEAEAMYQAQDIMNFTRSGDYNAIRFLIRTVPFLNARIQGLNRLYRGAKEHPVGFMLKGAALMAASLALLARNWDDKDYERLEGYQKDTNWNFFVDGVQYAIPKPFEVGLIFGTVPERMARFIFGRDDTSELAESAKAAMLSTLAFNPIPQLFKPMYELGANKNLFTGNPIVNMAMEGMEYDQQATPWTSPVAQAIGKVMPEWTGPAQSPLRIEHAIRAYLGTVGLYTLNMADAAIRSMDSSIPERPASRWYEKPVLSRVIKGEGESSRHNKYTEKMYAAIEDSNKAFRTINALVASYKVDEAKELLEKRKNLLGANRDALNEYATAMREINAAQKAIQLHPTMSPEDKRAKMDELNVYRNRLLDTSAPLLDAVRED